MKKIIAAMLVSCMVLSPAVVMAEESTESTDSTEMTEVNWEEDIVTPGAFEDVIKDGRFVTFDEIAVQMWVPNVLEDVELTDEDKKDGYIGYYQSADGSYAAAVMYVDVKGEDLEAYKTLTKEYFPGEQSLAQGRLLPPRRKRLLTRLRMKEAKTAMWRHPIHSI